MSRVRVSEIVKELGIETKAVLAQLNKMGVSVKNHLSMISDTDATKLKNVLKTGKSGSAKKPANKIFIRRKVAEPKPPASEIKKAVKSSVHTDARQEKPTPKSAEVSASTSHAVEQTVPKSEDIAATERVTVHDDAIKKQIETKASVQKEAVKQTSVDTDTKTTSAEDLEKKQDPLKEDLTLETKKTTIESRPAVKIQETESKSQTVETAKLDQSSVVTPKEDILPSKEPLKVQQTTPPAAEKSSDESAKPKLSFQSATIVRRGPENVYQVNMARPARSHDSSTSGGPRRPYGAGGGRPGGARPGGGYSSTGGTRPGGYSSSAGARPGGGYNNTATQKPFVTPDSMADVSSSKDFSARNDKFRGKDKDKRRGEEELRNKNRSAKGSRFYERDDTIDDLIVLDESGTEIKDTGINVRTMVSSKKRKSTFKRKDARNDNNSANPTKASKKIIRIDEHISVNDLALEMSLKSAVIIKSLMNLGMLATANKVLDFDTATLVANEFGFETQNVTVSLEDIISKNQSKAQTEVEAAARPPIITIMGHVDHGKTSLLDALRKTNVVSGEAGGITQHIGAYQIEYQDRKLTFLDTPGHEAFTEMRARGAKVTDIVILVVAADDGVMPQTMEAIAHSKAAGVPIIVAINKVDKPNINLDRLNSELAEQGVISEEWGGDSMFIKVSAKTGEGLDKLIEGILLQAEILDLKSPAQGFAEGVVIEAKRDKARGPVATVIVTEGLLKQQDSIVIGKTMGRVRAMHNDKGSVLKEALPGTPVEIIGLNDVPNAGDAFYAVASDAIAREAVAYKVEKHRQAQLANQKPTNLTDLQALFSQQETTEKATELNLIIKADTHGSVEAIKASLEKLDTAKVKNKIILAAVGGITETDVVLADASHAIIIGFNVRPDKIASQRAESSGVKMMFFNIIYELIDAVKVSMAGTLAPVQQDKIIGHAEIRNLFTVPKVGVIAGCLVTDGKVTRPCRLRVIRDGIVGYSGHLGSLKRFKDDAKEVQHGFECGIGIENYNDLKVGDILEAYIIEEFAAVL